MLFSSSWCLTHSVLSEVNTDAINLTQKSTFSEPWSFTWILFTSSSLFCLALVVKIERDNADGCYALYLCFDLYSISHFNWWLIDNSQVSNAFMTDIGLSACNPCKVHNTSDMNNFLSLATHIWIGYLSVDSRCNSVTLSFCDLILYLIYWHERPRLFSDGVCLISQIFLDSNYNLLRTTTQNFQYGYVLIPS